MNSTVSVRHHKNGPRLLHLPKFTIVVPTRDRARTLLATLRCLAATDYPNLTVIVSDNGVENTVETLVSLFDPARFQYIRPDVPLCMSDHWEFALSKVTEGWITFLGDDDALMPNTLWWLANLIDRYAPSAIASTPIAYFWPELARPISGGYALEGAQWVNSRRALKGLMGGRFDYLELPCLYGSGWTTIEQIKSARRSDGRFFCSAIPDTYSGIALASITERFLFSRVPLKVNGVSNASNGYQHMSSTGTYAAGTVPHRFWVDNSRDLASWLPPPLPRSIEIMVFDSYLCASHLHKDKLRVNPLQQLELAEAHAESLHRTSVKDYCSKVRSSTVSAPSSFYARLGQRVAWGYESVLRKIHALRRIYGERDMVISPHPPDVYEASLAIDQHIKNRTLRPHHRLARLGKQLMRWMANTKQP